ncbi:uncharacterized protein [Diadema setosum]|uniref:uncharacterized protein n=1 Tax=Diadema setosum TaxID=31175 RepID=UPI003B3AB989
MTPFLFLLVWWCHDLNLAHGQTGMIAPTCDAGSQLCPVSQACYEDNWACDNFDDCGTSFDEIGCKETQGDITACPDVIEYASTFKTHCQQDSSIVGAFGAEGVPDGAGEAPTGVLYFIGSTTPGLAIESILFQPLWLPFSGTSYVMFNFTFGPQSSPQLEPVILTRTVNPATEEGPIEWQLRTPLLLEGSQVDRVEVAVSYVGNAEPTVETPYRPATNLSLVNVVLRYGRYRPNCGEGLFDPCLINAREYAAAVRNATLLGATCEPRERVNIAYDLYSRCFDPPLPVQPKDTAQVTPSPSSTRGVLTTMATTPSPTSASPCGGSLVCPVSKACYSPEEVCDYYNDCGTSFDENSCPRTDEETRICENLQARATEVNDACIVGTRTQQATDYGEYSGADFIIDGKTAVLPPDSVSNWLIQSVTVDPTYFPYDINFFALVSINASSEAWVGTQYNVNVSMADLENRTSEESIVSAIVRELRTPLKLNLTNQDAVRLSILHAGRPPSSRYPYTAPETISYRGIQLTFVRYSDACGYRTSEELSGSPSYDNACLRAFWTFMESSEEAASRRLTCMPPERLAFLSNLYPSCFAHPSTVLISSNQTAVPGTVVNLICAAEGRPIPSVVWYLDADACTEVELDDHRNLRFSSPCLSVRNLTSVYWDFFTENIEFYSLPSSGQLHSIFLPYSALQDNLLFQPFRINSVRLTVSVEAPGRFPQRRRRRRVLPVLYERDYQDIDRVVRNGFDGYRIVITHPVPIEAGTRLLVMAQSLDSFQRILPSQNPVLLEYLECSNLTASETYSTCLEILNEWKSTTEELIRAGCRQNVSPLFKSYQACLQIADEPPTVTDPDLGTMELRVYSNFTVYCPIRGGISRWWMKRTAGGPVLPSDSPSPILRFENFGTEDQGYYFCEASPGNGSSGNGENVVTTDMLLTLRDVITVGFSITFDTEFIAVDDPSFPSTSFTLLLFPIKGGISRSTIMRKIVGGGPQFGYDIPFIVNTRNGSMIVDYQASVSGSDWANETELVSAMTDLLVEYMNSTVISPPVVPGSIVVGSVSSCPASEVEGSSGTLSFPSAALDEVANSVERCPEYSGNAHLPRATRVCRGDFISPASWAEPVMTDCFPEDENSDEVLMDIANTPVTKENVTAYTNDLVDATNQSSTITSEGLDAVATSLQNVVAVRNGSEEVTRNIIQIVDNVLDVDTDEYLDSLDVEAPTRILDSLEEQVSLFQLQDGGVTNLSVVDRHLAVTAISVPRRSLRAGLGFATLIDDDQEVFSPTDVLGVNDTMIIYDTEELPKNDVEASILLPSVVLDFIPQEKEDVPISFFIFQTSKLFLSTEGQTVVTTPGYRQTVGSRVISATVEGAVVQNLPPGEEVESYFLELNVTDEDETVDNRSCVFWEKTVNGGRWSTEGCRREDLPGIHRIRCVCDHLTSFAVLLDISGDIGIYALDILGTIGCIISIVCLVIMLLTYLCVANFRKRQPQRIHINLCVALLGLYLVFVIGIDRHSPTSGCIAIGFLIHYFLLASMAWMLVEAVYMYVLFVTVHSGTVSKFLRIATVSAWTPPLVACVVIVVVDKNLYLGDGTYCFATAGPAIYYGVMLPVGLVLITNCVIFVLVTYRLTCGRWSLSANKNQDSKKKRQECWRLLQDLIAFTILLGLTWVFGFLAIGDARFVFNVLFLVFNSLQGLGFFFMFGLRQKAIRDHWLRLLCCRCREDAKGSRRSDPYTKTKPTTKSTNSSAITLDTKNGQRTGSRDPDSETIALHSQGSVANSFT